MIDPLLVLLYSKVCTMNSNMKQVPHKQLNNRKRAAPIQEVQFVKGGEYGQCGTSSKCSLNFSCRLAGRIGENTSLGLSRWQISWTGARP